MAPGHLEIQCVGWHLRPDPAPGKLRHRSKAAFRSGPIFGASFTEVLMWDVIMVAIGIGLFGLSIGYAYACDRL